MKKLLIFLLFCSGLWFALATYLAGVNPGQYDSIVIDFRESVGESQIEQMVADLRRQYGQSLRLNSFMSKADHLYVMPGDAKLLKTLRQSVLKQQTEFIEPNYLYQATAVPNDPDYERQWNFRSLNLEEAWQTSRGKGVVVAVIDTGITQVKDLQQTRFVAGYDFVNDREKADDDNGHGTHVAGTIAQSTNNHYGVAGIAYEASLMPLKVLSAEGGGTVADIAEAIRFAADHNAKVINMSLGGGGESHVMREAIDYAHRKGVVIVAAAGNSNQNSAEYPARYPHVIGVSALDATGSKAFYSSYGAGVDISAPGGSTREGDRGGILQGTIDPDSGQEVFAAYQGTSMAAPHVSGVAALVQAVAPKSPDEVLEVLQQSARKVRDDGMNYYGAGHLDAAAALRLATKGQLSLPDFFRWLRDNGYLNPVFWFDGGVVNLLPKVLMVVGSYLLAWLLRNFLPFAWNGWFHGGLIFGSSGLFLLRGLYIFDLPQWPLRLLGSSLPELGTAIQGSSALNPVFASVLFPLGLILLLLGHPQGRALAIGTTLGVTACLAVTACLQPNLVWLGSGWGAQIFLGINALLCFGLARLALKASVDRGGFAL